MSSLPSDDKGDWQRIAAAFDELSELPPADRLARLHQLEQQQPEIAAEVASLLHSLDAQPYLLEKPAVDLQSDNPLPDRIGPYRILGRLGQGGMGSVYRAARDDGAYSQQVAVKLVRGGADNDAGRQRFVSERQILAKLDHPGIARLLDGGTTPDGNAYLVMQLVDGIPIDLYCEQHRLDLDARLRLFVKVCRAVDYAHRNLVVHRDIKPANVLVDAEGNPQVLDFGIAKILNDELQSLTRTGMLPMTPEYASPEQITGQQITTASDVYALGVLLFKLLTGSLPLRLQELTLDKAIERVLKTTPPRPSEVAGSSVGITGDLDAITAMALQKEPHLRYASAADLARDVESHLAGHPVIARPDTWIYRGRKFAGRHKWSVILALLVTVGLLSTTGIALWQAHEATRQRDQAQLERTRATQEAERAQQILTFLENTLASASPEQAQGKELTVRELLDETAGSLAAQTLEAVSRLAILDTLSRAYLSLGLAEQGRPLAQEAAVLARKELGENDLHTLAAQHALARFHLAAADYAGAIRILEPLLAKRRQLLGRHLDTSATLTNLAIAYAGLGRAEDALRLDLQQLEITRELTGADSNASLTGLINVGTDYYDLGRYPEATEVFTEVMQRQVDRYGEKHPLTLNSMNNLAVLLRKSGDTRAAEALHRKTLALRREVLGSQHPDTLNSLNNLGELYLVEQRLDEALPLLQEAYTGRAAVLGPGHEDSLESMVSLSRITLRMGQAMEAERLARQALTLALDNVGEDSKAAGYAAAALVESLLAEQRFADALELATNELDRRRQRLGADHPETREMAELQERALAAGGATP